MKINDIINFIFFDEFGGYDLKKRRSPRKIKQRINYLEIFDDIDFNTRFRVSKEHFMMLLEKIEDEVRQNTD